ncbi:unnamed protein product [Lymnaea stagnalis]|uniref:Regucalcin n=1 Tax=Lymnaea stagnalis TaxID=6523 RepID=A0AAV2GXC4_LYMST
MANEDYKLEVVVQNCFQSIGEAPHWEVPTQSLLCVDIFNGGILRWHRETGKIAQINVDGNIGFAIPRSQGGLIVGHNNSLATLDFETKKLGVLATVEDGTGNRFNDAKCDASGRLWAGTMGPVVATGTPQMGVGTLYSLSPDHKLASHLTELNISNGMDWSPDNTVMDYIDSMSYSVAAFDFDISSGTMSNKRVLAEFDDKSMLPDGMCTDIEGKLWVAFYRGSRVCRLDPETGKTLQTILFPATNVTSCCFGGKDLDELYVTSSVYQVSADDLKHKQPLAGSVFRVTGLGVKGKPANNFRG